MVCGSHLNQYRYIYVTDTPLVLSYGQIQCLQFTVQDAKFVDRRDFVTNCVRFSGDVREVRLLYLVKFSFGFTSHVELSVEKINKINK